VKLKTVVSVTSAAPAVSDPQQQAQQRAEEAEKIMLDALEIEANNALAAKSITLIEDIDKSMGRPVPAPA
jgi:hypothetical protein